MSDDDSRVSTRVPLVAWVVGAAVLAVSVWCWATGYPAGVDSAVYRAGSLAVLRGESLYQPLTSMPSWAPGLPFTYLPCAALLFAPLAVLPAQLVWGVLGLLSAVAVGLTMRLAVGGGRALTVGLGTVAVLGLEPVWRSVGLGQVNLLLMAVIALDVLALKGSRYSGVLIGVASAIKLTPLIFVLHLLVTGRRADAARALATFAGLNLLAAVLLPGDTAAFWSGTLLGGNKATSNGWVGNQSINGLLQRSGLGSATMALYVLLAVVCLVVAAVVVRRLHDREPMGALLVTALCGLLVSPISWTHHWVWVVPAVGLLLRPWTGVWRWVALAATAVVFSGWQFTLVPSGAGVEVEWHAGQWLLGNVYLLAAAVAVGVLVWLARAQRRSAVPGMPAL
ncbi:alpha-1,2-mannosyltransferase [Herbihabitans rhizosphaerae]|uniref:Alpha-1,2-mannosyltransferase n=1 Tax=Herbihabitans rhizosphaerae TaxID=1872711 RepID=A0A4Q7KXV8_9PSEU|nr:glycosyltransferase 87 family protein [Herbihabitans rhizosphaerae]RZS40841.1 alpha-1,2-mannosyltransferase [Herbihabitans rhizosphaerae]